VRRKTIHWLQRIGMLEVKLPIVKVSIVYTQNKMLIVLVVLLKAFGPGRGEILFLLNRHAIIDYLKNCLCGYKNKHQLYQSIATLKQTLRV
jgi:hypothetical protein